ncbi:DUF6292 family protein [Nonomuraea sp. NPDC048916]|uniref:DUF6292 family protein n=1 Tax=Nonomuraea sp. NPDC048916 TaxID=3154232 RepID=UPI003410F5A9
MGDNLIAMHHPDPWVDLTHGYVSQVVGELSGQGVRIDRSWLDPADPRDATVIIRDGAHQPLALVWDEETGWRHGIFESGCQGVRTRLSAAAGLGGGILPSGNEVAWRLKARTVAEHVKYRSCADVRDGLDDKLRTMIW